MEEIAFIISESRFFLNPLLFIVSNHPQWSKTCTPWTSTSLSCLGNGTKRARNLEASLYEAS